MKEAAERSRITAFRSGYSGVGKWKAVAPEGEENTTDDSSPASEEATLAFYLGEGTRLGLQDAASV